MTKNWYVLSTKLKQEKKIAAILTKRGIENYCPYTNVERFYGTKSVVENQPLFNRYVFAALSAEDILSLRDNPYEIDLVYWLSSPAVINKEEVEAIKIMTENYINIRVEKAPINLGGQVDVSEESTTDYGNKLLSIRYQGIAITLPSLGYKLVAERQENSSFSSESKNIFGNLLLKSA